MAQRNPCRVSTPHQITRERTGTDERQEENSFESVSPQAACGCYRAGDAARHCVGEFRPVVSPTAASAGGKQPGQGAEAPAPQVTGQPGAPGATTTIDGKQLPPPDPKFGGVIKENAAQSKAWWAPRVVPPKGAPNVLLIMTDDVGFGAPSTFGGVIPTPALDRIAKSGPALHAVPFHRPLLADARGAHHRPQPSLGRLRRGLGAVHRLPRLQQHHPQGQGHHRPDPQGQRLRHLVVRQGPQHADLPGQPGRAVRPVAHRHGLRVLLRLRRRRHQPVGAEPVPQHHGHLSLRRQARLEPDHRHGRRRHRLAEPAQPDRSRASRSSATTCPAARTRRITRRRNGSTRSTTCTCSTRAGTSSATRSSPTRRSSA